MAVGEYEAPLRVHDEAARIGAPRGLGVCAPVLRHPAQTKHGPASDRDECQLHSLTRCMCDTARKHASCLAAGASWQLLDYPSEAACRSGQASSMVDAYRPRLRERRLQAKRGLPQNNTAGHHGVEGRLPGCRWRAQRSSRRARQGRVRVPAFDLAVQIFRGVEASAELTLASALDALRLGLHAGEPRLSDNRDRATERSAADGATQSKALERLLDALIENFLLSENVEGAVSLPSCHSVICAIDHHVCHRGA